jgi:hypothetical protein
LFLLECFFGRPKVYISWQTALNRIFDIGLVALNLCPCSRNSIVCNLHRILNTLPLILGLFIGFTPFPWMCHYWNVFIYSVYTMLAYIQWKISQRMGISVWRVLDSLISATSYGPCLYYRGSVYFKFGGTDSY